jgi:hypothetical protein
MFIFLPSAVTAMGRFCRAQDNRFAKIKSGTRGPQGVQGSLQARPLRLAEQTGGMPPRPCDFTVRHC